MTTTPTPTSGAADLPAMVSKALREAYSLGQRYWQQADSEYISQHKKADDTRAKFLALVEETCAALAAGQATATQPAPVLWVSPEQFANFMDADEAQFGRYVPARKTCTGNFTMPLFAAPAQPAAEPANADSVQEDAALWCWLAEYLVGTRTDLDDEIVASETVNDLRKLVKAAIKQGEKP